MKNIVITGGAGFIGSHVVRLFVNKYPEYNIINLDKLTYAGNLANLKDIEDKPNYKFVKMDICDFEAFYQLMQDEKVDGIIHLAAESHVDRSIKDPFTFAQTNVMVEGFEIADIHLHELVVRLVFNVLQVGQVTGIGQLVQTDDFIFRVFVDEQTYHVTANETGTTGDDYILHIFYA